MSCKQESLRPQQRKKSGEHWGRAVWFGRRGLPLLLAGTGIKGVICIETNTGPERLPKGKERGDHFLDIAYGRLACDLYIRMLSYCSDSPKSPLLPGSLLFFSRAGPRSTGIRAIKDSTNIALHVRAYVLATWEVQVQGRPSAHPAILFRLWQDR